MAPLEGSPKEEIKDLKYTKLVQRYNKACENVDNLHEQIKRAKENDDTTPEQRDELTQDFASAVANRDSLYDQMRDVEKLEEARKQHRPLVLADSKYVVREPDIYREDNEKEVSFFQDLYYATLGRGQNPAAEARIAKHQAHEIEKRAVTSSTLGGIIPAQYLVDLYAKASRNGRVFADQVNNARLPDVGMSVIIPRLTQGLAAAAQTTQNTAVVTQDPSETDLTVNVNTVAGYSPVSRQAIERAAYSDQILFEDLTARYWAVLDTYCINGSGSNNQPLGLLGTSSIATSTASTASAVGVYPKIADVIQQIAGNVGGLGYQPDKIFMHPRRWGMFNAALDSQNRPLVVPDGPAFNQMGNPDGARSYGYVGTMQGLPVFVDANIPTNLGTNTNEDRIIVCASQLVHLFERANDPVTLSFEQQAGTSLQVQLVVYGYVAFTAGRYPGASGVISGAGLVPPTF